MTQQEPRRPARWLKPALAVSLILNLLVIGIVIGALAGRHRWEDRHAMRDRSFGPYTEAFSHADRTALRKAFLAALPDRAEARRGDAEGYARLTEALRADPFDPEAVAKAIGMQEAQLSARLELGQRLLTERILSMTPEARKAFADRIEEALKHRRKD